jgi:hypothetical protein
MQHRFLTGPRYPTSLASDAASYAIETDQLEHAVELLEQGKALLWSERLRHSLLYRLRLQKAQSSLSTSINIVLMPSFSSRLACLLWLPLPISTRTSVVYPQNSCWLELREIWMQTFQACTPIRLEDTLETGCLSTGGTVESNGIG